MATQESRKEVQVSFRTTPEIKRLARIEAAKEDKTLNEWIKHLVEKNLSEASSRNSESS
ncbi:toxin-antitoxin system HicB family antitoxin [Acinetobacter sp. ANC 4648]|uniref:toxin-antitoxin system HicB family antitoxin n=1 Tax=Acinetobacter sp. ANC 4648 TaxID=1977875 RepID=UPI0011785CA4|nr:toxin-antitoxin system HicB family antitoxin [Acinetobacter sp. ANC 4648]